MRTVSNRFSGSKEHPPVPDTDHAQELNSSPFVFAISLQPRLVSHDWHAVEENLRHTIRSIRRGRNAKPLIVIACHDPPELGSEAGDEVIVLQVPFAPETDLTQRLPDKIRKRRFIGAWLKSRRGWDGLYVMFLDADDLVHRDLAAYVLSDDNRRSYLVTQGYRYDCRSGVLDRRPATFHRICASSFIGYFRRDELPRSWEDTDSAFAQFGCYPPIGHQDYDKLAADLGKQSDEIPFNAVVYTINHGESLRSTRINHKIRETDVRHLVLPGRAKQVLADDFGFGSEDAEGEAPAVAGPARFARAVLGTCLRKVRGKLSLTQSGAIGRITLGLFLAAVFLMALHVTSAAAPLHQSAGLRHFLSLNSAASLGEWYATVQFLFCAVLLTLIARSEFGRTHRWYWGTLAAGFYGLSLDEGAQLHELITDLMHRPSWLLPGLAMVAVLGVSYLRFLLLLPRRTAMQFAVAGAIFLAGVFGPDLIGNISGASLADAGGWFCRGSDCDFSSSVMVALEEGMELIGVAIFANALLHLCLAACPKLVTVVE
jgi:hypothetical protein